MNRRQLGKFNLDVRRIEDASPDIWKMMSTVIPVRAEYMYHSDCIEFTALSHSFAPVGLGHTIPWYKAIINEEGVLRWERIDE